MNQHEGKLIAVAGATGQQGGAVTRHLLRQGWKVRALTRDPNKDAAKALAALGAEIFQNDLDDRAGLDEALKGSYGAFSVQNYWLPNVGYEGEIKQGKIFADAAKAAGVRHFVYSSVGAAHRGMGQKHFDSKWEIEKYIQSLDLPYTILRPVFFMENMNYQRAAISNGMYISLGLRPDKTIQMIASDDIGAFVATVFANPQEYLGKTIELATEELTEPEIVTTLSKVIGRPVNLVQPQFPEGQAPSEEQIAMGAFFSGEAYTADIAAVRQVLPQYKNLEQYLRSSGWENLPSMQMSSSGESWG